MQFKARRLAHPKARFGRHHPPNQEFSMRLIDQCVAKFGPMTRREMEDLHLRLIVNRDDIPRLELVCVALGNWTAYRNALADSINQASRERRLAKGLPV
jgi:hypothetical protein